MKKIVCVIFMSLCFSFAAQAKKSSYTLSGLTKETRNNVEKRLDELQQMRPLNEMTEAELRQQINNALQPFGYFKAQIKIMDVTPNTLTSIINLGPVVHISTLKVQLTGEGANAYPLQKTLKELPLKVGAPLLTRQYNEAKQSLTNTAENLGYLHNSFKTASILIDENTNTAEVILIFATGPQFYFGQVQFDPANISPELMHRFVPFRTNQPYSTDQVLKFNNYLSNSGYFSSVLVKPEITDSSTVPIKVHLQPVPKYSYSLGAGYGTDTGVRGRAGLYITPVNRLGHKFNAIAQGSFRQNALQGQYLMPGKNPLIDQYNLTGNFSNLNYDAGYSNAYQLSFGQQHNLNNFKRNLSLNALYESFRYTDEPNTDQFLLYPKGKFTYTKVQNPLFSPSGYTLNLNTLGASKAVLSQISFAQGSVDLKGAYWIPSVRLRLYGHLISGATAIDNVNDLPLTLALLLGGTDNLKGYSFNSIGPGKIVNYAGVELQKEVVKNWYLLGFYDAGNTYNPDPSSPLYDAGAGLMWVSPIGPIKLGVAQPITRNFQFTDNNPRLVVSMGPDL